MHSHQKPTVRSLLIAAACTLIGAPAFASDVATMLDQATDLYAKGQYVHVEALLTRMVVDEGASTMTDAERTRVFELRAQARAQLRRLDPMARSLQRAEFDLQDDNLVEARRHAMGVLSGGTTTDLQRAEAERLLVRINRRQETLAPKMGALLDDAFLAFVDRRYDEATDGVSTVVRSGVEMTTVQLAQIEHLQNELAKVERLELRGVDAASAGLVQPGVVNRTDADDQPADDDDFVPVEDVRGGNDSNRQPVEDLTDEDQPAEDVDDGSFGQPGEDLVTTARRMEAQSLLAEARTAADNGQWNTALQKYVRLRTEYTSLLSAQQRSQVESGYQEAQTQLNQGSLLDDVQRDIEFRRDKAQKEFQNNLTQARAALETGDTGAAGDYVAQARFALNSERDVFETADYERMMESADRLSEEIDVARDRIQDAEARARQERLEQEARETQQRTKNEKEQKISELIERARALQSELKYEEARQVVEQILMIDPVHPAGLLLHDILSDAEFYRDWWSIDNRKSRSYSLQSMQGERALEAPANIIDYPRDWPEISYMRGEPVAYSESAADRRTLAVLDSKEVEATFNDNALGDVLTFIETVAQVNMDVDWEALETLGINQDTPVNLNLSPVPLATILDRVLDKVSVDDFSRAGWAVDQGILVVSSEDELRKNTSLEIYDIRDLTIEVPDYENAPEFDLQSVLQSSGQGGGGGRSPFQNTQDQEDVDRIPLEERIDNIIDIITQNVDPEGWVDNGGETGMIQQLNGNLIITNTPKNHRQIQGLLSKLRQIQAMQINVETRFLLVSQDFFEQIGFDLDVYLNANNNQVRAAQAVDPGVQASDFFTPPGGTFGLQRQVIGPAPTNTAQTAPNADPWSPLGFGQNSLNLASALMPTEGIAASVLGSSPALGIAGQFLDDIQVDFLIQATQADRRSVTLTAPRLTFTNGQTSNIFVATQQAFVSDLEPVVSDSAVGFDPELDVISEGVRLLVEGIVSADRRYVTLNVDAAIATIDDLQSQGVTAVAGGQLVSSADTQSFIQLPITTVTRVQTTVNVPDQGTILLGGQRLMSETEVESGVPVLSKIPILNRFFSNRIESKEEQTLLILLKPTVLIQNEQEERNYPGLLDSLGNLGG